MAEPNGECETPHLRSSGRGESAAAHTISNVAPRHVRRASNASGRNASPLWCRRTLVVSSIAGRVLKLFVPRLPGKSVWRLQTLLRRRLATQSCRVHRRSELSVLSYAVAAGAAPATPSKSANSDVAPAGPTLIGSGFPFPLPGKKVRGSAEFIGGAAFYNSVRASYSTWRTVAYSSNSFCHKPCTNPGFANPARTPRPPRHRSR